MQRGLFFLNAHFTVYLYAPSWVFALSVYRKAVVGYEDEQTAVKHPRFFIYVVNPSKFYSFALDVCGEKPLLCEFLRNRAELKNRISNR